MENQENYKESPLFIRGLDFRFGGKPTYFYFCGIQENPEGRDLALYNSAESGSTYSLDSIIKDMIENKREYVFKLKFGGKNDYKRDDRTGR